MRIGEPVDSFGGAPGEANARALTMVITIVPTMTACLESRTSARASTQTPKTTAPARAADLDRVKRMSAAPKTRLTRRRVPGWP